MYCLIVFVLGYCFCYSEVDGKFINKFDLDCIVFDFFCLNRFILNEFYKCKELIVLNKGFFLYYCVIFIF